MPPKKVSKLKKQQSTSLLDKIPYLKGIIEFSSIAENECLCLLCTKNQLPNRKGDNKRITFGRKGLKAHLASHSHRTFTKGAEGNIIELEKAIQALSKSSSKKDKSDENDDADDFDGLDEDSKDNCSTRINELPLSKTKEAELYLTIAKFIVTSHLPFNSAPRVLELIQSITSQFDQRLVQNAHLSDKTMSQIIRRCISDDLQDELFNYLQKAPFSLMIDESSDFYGGKYLALLIRYIDDQEQKPATKLITIVELEDLTTGEELYKRINASVFRNDPLIKQNLIGLCTDNASNMLSSKDAGVSNRLMVDISHLVHVRDLCHCYNLIVEDALKVFPVYIIQFIKKTCSFFNKGQRYQGLKKHQQARNRPNPLEVLRYIEERWFTLLDCSERILLLWEEIETYLEEGTDSPLKDDFKNPEYKLYVYLLTILLHRLVGYINAFQKPDLLFDQVIKKVKQGYIIFGRMLLKDKFQDYEFDDLIKVPFRNPKDAKCLEVLADSEEFSQIFNLHYPNFPGYVQKFKDSVSLKRTEGEINREVYGNARQFILEVMIST